MADEAIDEPSLDEEPVRRPRRRRRWLRGVLIFLACVAAYIGLIAWLTKRPVWEDGWVLTVRLEGALPESPSDDPLAKVQGVLNDKEGPISLHELRRALMHAKKDPKVPGVLLELHPIQAGWGAVEEARALIADLRAAGKPVYALLSGDFVEEKEYLLALEAQRIVLNPEGGLMLNGLNAEVLFLRGVLDNLRVEPQVLQLKEYKSAGEQLVNKQMSPAMREEYESLLSQIYERFLQGAAKARGIDPAALRTLVNQGVLTAQQALSAKLVDSLGYRDELLADLQGKGKLAAARRVKAGTVGRYVRTLPDEPDAKKAQVALVYAVGAIVSGGEGNPLLGSETIHGEKLARAIRLAAEDDDIKAIVMRVDSPGGSAVGSDFIWRAIEQARKKKPVVVSMGSVAGSGGYWISMGADAIVAEPDTLTGSIGVVALHLNVRPLAEWSGATLDTIKYGDHADIMSLYRPWSEDDQKLLLGWMNAVYADFVRKAADGRHLPEAQLEPLAHGRVWSGAQAKERKLVDEVGDLRAAIALARARARLPADPDAEPAVFPRPQGLALLLQKLAVAVQGRPLPGLEALLLEKVRGIGTDRPLALMPNIDIR